MIMAVKTQELWAKFFLLLSPSTSPVKPDGHYSSFYQRGDGGSEREGTFWRSQSDAWGSGLAAQS